MRTTIAIGYLFLNQMKLDSEPTTEAKRKSLANLTSPVSRGEADANW